MSDLLVISIFTAIGMAVALIVYLATKHELEQLSAEELARLHSKHCTPIRPTEELT